MSKRALLLALIGAVPSAALAQEGAGHAAFFQKPEDFVTVTAGERYAADALKRTLARTGCARI